jgi:hypothetical protein
MDRSIIAVILGIVILYFPKNTFSQYGTPPAARATQPYIEFKFGQLTPADAQDGIVFGMSTGRRIDDRLFWGFEWDYFYTSYTQISDVSGSEQQVAIDFTTKFLTFLFLISYEARMGPGAFFFRGSGGLGIDMIWDKQQSLTSGTSRTEYYTGFAWQVTGGIGWQISRQGLLFFDLVYHGSEFAEGDVTVIDGLPVINSIDVSGFGFRGGINIIGFWFWKW